MLQGFLPCVASRKPGGEDPPRTQFKDKAAVVYVKKSFADGAAAIETKGDSGISEAVVDPFGYDDPKHAGKAQIRLSELAHNLIDTREKSTVSSVSITV